MKLQELISHRPYVKGVTTRYEVQQKLGELGFKKIGDPSGYAGVYAHPNFSYVLKVFDATDIGYLTFLQVVGKHPNNPHFPIFRGKPMVLIKSDITDYPRVMTIRMEKLTTFPISRYIDRLEYMLSSATSTDWRNNIKHNDLAKEFLEEWPKFGEALDLLVAAKTDNIAFDWHEGNVMLRGNCPVIIDPFRPFYRSWNR